MKKKSIIVKDSMLAFLVIFVLVDVIIYAVCVENPCIQAHITLSADAVRSISSMQITISLVSITIMTLFLGSINEKILGISYKRIFFRGDFFKFFNIPNCIFLMLIFIVCSVVSSLLLVNMDYSEAGLFGKIVCVVSLFCSIFLLFYMIFLGFILKYKQSRIYRKIYKILESKKALKIYHEIVEKLDVFEIKENESREYIIEEFIILSYICLNIKNFETNISEQKRVLQKIVCKTRNMIKSDPRDDDVLLDKLYGEVKEIFGEDKAKKAIDFDFFHE